jgi:hypothetical protein
VADAVAPYARAASSLLKQVMSIALRLAQALHKTRPYLKEVNERAKQISPGLRQAQRSVASRLAN